MFPSSIWPNGIPHPLIVEVSSKSREESSGDELSGKTLSSTTSHPDDHDQGLLSASKPSSIALRQQASSFHHHLQQQQQHEQHQHQQQGLMASHSSSRTEAASEHQSPPKQPQHKGLGGTKSDKVPDVKRQRRLAQNREAARKSRLRKKAYVQQLESSRIKLAQLEQDLQRARSQGLFFGAAGGASAISSSGGATFEMEYGRWVEDDQRLISQLLAALQSQLSDGELAVIVDGYINHYNEIFQLKGVAAKSDVFHLLTGVWTSPAERCFLWIAGFRPSELIKMLVARLEPLTPLTEQQLMGICNLQESCQQVEEALSQGLDQLQQSLVHTIAPTTDVATDPMHQMALALAKLSKLEGFVHQADKLRQQTLHQLRRMMTVRQVARCFVMIGEYYGRLRALSSLWAFCPRDPAMMTEKNAFQAFPDLQMMQPSQIPCAPF